MKPRKAARRRKRPNRTPPPPQPLTRGEKTFLKFLLGLLVALCLYETYAEWYNDNINHYRAPTLLGIKFPHVWLLRQFERLPFPGREAVAQSEGQPAERIYYIHSDHLGSPLLLTDSNQQVVWRANAEPFGKTTPTANQIVYNPRFPGQYEDTETGLHYNNRRDYHPSTGRYGQPDPRARVAESLYSYANGNPTRFVDPSGLSYLVFDRLSGRIKVYSRNGDDLGDYPAANNTGRRSNGPWPEGSFAYERFMPHHEGPNSSFGSVGNFIFYVPERTDMGIHAGRKNRGGPMYPTLGCVRTTDEGTAAIYRVHFGYEDEERQMSVAPDPLTHITLSQGIFLTDEASRPDGGNMSVE